MIDLEYERLDFNVLVPLHQLNVVEFSKNYPVELLLLKLLFERNIWFQRKVGKILKN